MAGAVPPAPVLVPLPGLGPLLLLGNLLWRGLLHLRDSIHFRRLHFHHLLTGGRGNDEVRGILEATLK